MPNLEIEGQSYPCEAIVFDKDGTLFDFMELWGAWADELRCQLEGELAKLGGSWTAGVELALGVKCGVNGAIVDYDRAGPLALASVEEMTGALAWQLYAAGLPWHQSVDAVRRCARAAEERHGGVRHIRPLPGLVRLLEEAHGAGIRLAVATSDTTASAQEHLRLAGLDGLFTAVCGRDLVREGKPAPDLALEACRRLGVRPANTIVIGDGGADLEMARRAGAALAIGLAPGGGPRGHLAAADKIIGSYDELRIVPGRGNPLRTTDFP
ncbi:hypothetical protein B9G55_00315 [Saccharibacillus sp. O16]|nr:hypothetical protein B9G55_00315 [Saccharibacillus sp. O16]